MRTYVRVVIETIKSREMNKIYFMLALLLASVNSSHAQKWAVKSNALYDATATINLGVEAALGKRVTLDVSGNYNPWEFGDARWKHWLIQPEVRYWLCESFNGHFFGLHAHYAEYNVGGIGFNDTFRHNRYQGHLYGAGISYGYQWLIGKRWNLEATVGVGYARLWDRKYPIAACGEVLRSRTRNYFGPTKIGLTFIFFIN